MYPALCVVIVLIATPINIDSDGQMKANICVTVSLSTSFNYCIVVGLGQPHDFYVMDRQKR